MKGSTLSDNIKKKISETVSKKTSFRHMGLNRKGNTSTESEIVFAELHPEFKREVSFGTGIGGLKKWKSTRFIADFVDEKNKIVYEIDGSSHTIPGRKDRDMRKDAFLKSIGYEVIRIKEDDLHAVIY